MRLRNKQIGPFIKKVETAYSSQVWNIKEGVLCDRREEQTTTSAQLKVLFVKEADSTVNFFSWPKRIYDMRKFLKRCDKGDNSV